MSVFLDNVDVAEQKQCHELSSLSTRQHKSTSPAFVCEHDTARHRLVDLPKSTQRLRAAGHPFPPPHSLFDANPEDTEHARTFCLFLANLQCPD